MKKKFWAVVLVAVVLLTACSSIPKKAAESDSLVVIKTEVMNPAGLQRGYEIVFHYSGGSADSLVGQFSWDYSLVVVKEQEAKLQSYTMQLQSPFRGNTTERTANLPLPYSAGGVAVADFVFVVKVEQTGMYEYTTRTGFRSITQEEKDDLMEYLKKDGRFASWSQ